MQTTTFETARIGDKVWGIRSGWGEIRATDNLGTYPIAVYFLNGTFEAYTASGLCDEEDVAQTLFWDEVKIDAPHKPLPKLEVDAKVLVWTDPSMKQRRHFSHFSKDGRIWTFDAGATSFTMLHRNSTTAWLYWELVE